ncbi:ribonuclease domain-containing protein [Nocardioides sp. DS6]|uniref:Ribonuclease domain-containing protein n=1 Tax=Nocardioides eburneus TaxID=3231482 RepID=A0ABV3SWZ5_9ACTN
MISLNKKTLSTLGSVLVVVVIAIVTACTQSGSGGDSRADGTPAPTGARTTQAPAPASGASRNGTDPGSGLPWVSATALPAEAQHTLALIDAGGPYPYPEHDDKTFGNYESILPKESRGYYREYTVETPGSEDRGARRIIRGDGGELYYTDDHYASFSRIAR